MDQSHPLWATWKNYCKQGGRHIVREWLDFGAFLTGVGEKPGPEFRLTRGNPGAKLGPENFHWKKKRTGSPGKFRDKKDCHHLYQRWLSYRRTKDGISKEWSDDFYVFVAGVGDPPGPSWQLSRANVYEPLGPDNFFWKEVKPDIGSEEKRKNHARYMREYMAANPRIRKHSSLMKQFGMTIEEYDVLLAKQNGVCAICASPETHVIRGKTVSLAVDHCHTTHKIRGLLCSDCNRGLGHFKDEAQRLRAAADYIERNTP